MASNGELSVDAVYRAVRDMADNVGQPAPVLPAVAVALWRECAGGIEVYLVKRSANLSFLGGFWSFVGGRIEEGDAAGANGPSAEIAAAVRETREELGIELPVASDAYVHGGRWLTPDYSPVRFDALFLLHEYDGGEPDPSRSQGELDEGLWLMPEEIEERWRTGECLISPPVLRVVAAMGEHAQKARDLEALAPRLDAVAREGEMRLWFPAQGIGVCPLRSPTLPPATHTNCYFIGSEEELVIVDPATGDERELEELDRCIEALRVKGASLREVLLTHHHFDHVAAAAYLSERWSVPIAAHAKTAELLQDRVVVTRHIADGERLHLAGRPKRVLRAVWTPGHAPGHLCFLEESTGALLAGDMVAGVGTILIEPSEGNMSDYLDSLERLQGIQAEAILPAHGPIITEPGRKLEEYVTHRLWREERVLAALADLGPCTSSRLVSEAYRDVPVAIHPIAERSLLAHLDRLESMGRVRRRGHEWVVIGSP